MKRHFKMAHLVALVLAASSLIWLGFADAKSSIALSSSGEEIIFSFETGASLLYRIETSSDSETWRPVRTVQGDGGEMHYSEPVIAEGGRQFFRTRSLEAGSSLTGDFLATASGDVLIHPVNHASFVMQWDGKTIYNDPVGGASAFSNIPPADLIIVGHRHGDHFSASTIDAVRAQGTVIVAPQDVYNQMSTMLKSLTTVLANGESTTVLGLTVEAVPAYNANHPQGRDNGYIVTIGEKRVYMSGDTEDIAEMRALKNIDVAFLSMNIPFTMDISHAASATREFKPKVIYPYHFRNQNGSFADLEAFRQLVGNDVGVEVRARDWY